MFFLHFLLGELRYLTRLKEIVNAARECMGLLEVHSGNMDMLIGMPRGVMGISAKGSEGSDGNIYKQDYQGFSPALVTCSLSLIHDQWVLESDCYRGQDTSHTPGTSLLLTATRCLVRGCE